MNRTIVLLRLFLAVLALMIPLMSLSAAAQVGAEREQWSQVLIGKWIGTVDMPRGARAPGPAILTINNVRDDGTLVGTYTGAWVVGEDIRLGPPSRAHRDASGNIRVELRMRLLEADLDLGRGTLVGEIRPKFGGGAGQVFPARFNK